MKPEINETSLRDHLQKYDQEHLIRFWADLSETEREQLYNDIQHTDLDDITRFYRQIKETSSESAQMIDQLMQPVAKELTGSVVESSGDELNGYYLKGLEKVAANQVAVLLLAGGQGTRLGVAYPKGMYSVNLASKKTLYQLQAERILRLEELAAKQYGKENCVITWYIMTSEHTKEATRNYFSQHGYFGLKSENVVFFEQYTLPCLTHEGKIILDSKFKLSRAPDGNGGLYRALRKQEIVEDMIRRGIQHTHVYCVDNILVKMADPIFIGFCIEKNANCAAKVVKKAFPEEAVGVICKVQDRYQVVEYSEISPKTAQERNADGELKFNAGNICNHYFRTDFLQVLCRDHESELKHHVAEKKIPFVDENGVYQTPSKPNGIKLEKFVFDVFQFSTNFALWEVIREDEFSPLKNADGAKKDTPTTCRTDLLKMHHKWLVAACAKYGDTLKDNQAVVEISPLVSYAGEGLSQVVNDHEFTAACQLEIDSETKTTKIIS